MKSLLLAAALLAAPIAAQAQEPAPFTPVAPERVSVFIVAHPDDFQLFMNPNAFRAMDEPNEKAVFVHLTAGDAGRGKTGKPAPYYKAREEGAARAVRFMANAHPYTGRGDKMERSKVKLAGRTVERLGYSNAALYFLRLPDGNGDGQGYDATDRQSLQALKDGAKAELRPVTGGPPVKGWGQLVDTLSELIAHEKGEALVLSVHVQEPEEALNPGEHSDHRHSAWAGLEAAARFPCAEVSRYDTYDTGNRPENLASDDLMIEAGTWGVTASGLSDRHAHSTWDPIHNSWLGRQYARTTPGTGACR